MRHSLKRNDFDSSWALGSDLEFAFELMQNAPGLSALRLRGSLKKGTDIENGSAECANRLVIKEKRH